MHVGVITSTRSRKQALSNTIQRYNNRKAQLWTNRDPKGLTETKRDFFSVFLSGFANVLDYQLYFARGEEMSLFGHTNLAELFTETGFGVDPKVQVVQGTAGGAGIGEI